MNGVEARSSESLRAEAAALDVRLLELDGKAQSQDAKIKLLSLGILRNDVTAAGRAAQCRDLLAKVREEMALIVDAKAVLDGEIRDALAREERERLDAAADEQDRAAVAVAGLGAKVDEAILVFKKALSEFRAAARHAGAYYEGHHEKAGGRELHLRAIMRNTLAWEFRDVPELEVKPPLGNTTRMSFDDIGRARAAAARGTALRLRAPPPVPKKPNGHRSDAIATILDEAVGVRRIPKQHDIAEPLNDGDPDFAGFTVKE
jgi:hypothetical protein